MKRNKKNEQVELSKENTEVSSGIEQKKRKDILTEAIIIDEDFEPPMVNEENDEDIVFRGTKGSLDFSTTTNYEIDKSNNLTKVLNIPSSTNYADKKLLKKSRNFLITLFLSIVTSFILLGIIISVAITIAIRNT
ncbi:hypothetical protein [Ureaplasma canigenitalium]|uniref:hypothetical protein n=1 Tax=Ureaplasma canigenitalium TaxID=42092 RepID=UPI0006896878|nr:hypothetical protein [Ureaplasma canigenitalium]